MLIGRLELKIDLLMSCGSSRIDYIIVEGNRLVLVDASYVPRVGASVSYFSVRNIIVLGLEGSNLSDCSINLDLLGAKLFNLCEESHLEFPILIDFKELLETLFEDWISKGISHNIVSTCLIEASLHFHHSNLI